MNALALDPRYRRISVEEFLAMDLGEGRAELVDGLIYMMAGGSARHAEVSGNIFAALHQKLRGSGCRPMNSDFAVKTSGQSARLPDVSVYCGQPSGPENDRKQLLGDPAIVFEVLSPSTAAGDVRDKLAEYQELSGLKAIVFVDTDRERIRLVERASASRWVDDWLPEGTALEVSAPTVELTHDEIFARG